MSQDNRQSELKNLKLYPSLHKMKNNREKYHNIDFNKLAFSIQEKIDGSNISIFKLKKQLYVYSRNLNITNKLTSISGITPFIESNKESLIKSLRNGEILNGEWLASGRIDYVKTLNELHTNERFIAFNLGKLTKLTIKQLVGDLSEKDKLKIKEAEEIHSRKINFYSNKYTLKRFRKDKFISTLKSTVGTLSDEQFRLLKLEKEWEVYDYNTNTLIGSTVDDSFETWLLNHPIYSKSKLFPSTEKIEGVVFKTNDNSIQLKYVIKEISKLHKTGKPKLDKPKHGKTPLTQNQMDWLSEVWDSEGRFNKFLQHISGVSHRFNGSTPKEIISTLEKQPALIGNIFSHINWLIDDIASEEVYDKDDSGFDLKDKATLRAVKGYLIKLITQSGELPWTK